MAIIKLITLLGTIIQATTPNPVVVSENTRQTEIQDGVLGDVLAVTGAGIGTAISIAGVTTGNPLVTAIGDMTTSVANVYMGGSIEGGGGIAKQELYREGIYD